MGDELKVQDSMESFLSRDEREAKRIAVTLGRDAVDAILLLEAKGFVVVRRRRLAWVLRLAERARRAGLHLTDGVRRHLSTLNAAAEPEGVNQ